MRLKEPVPVKWVAELINASIKGKEDGMVCGINEIHKVEPGDIVFVDHPKYYDKCLQSAASFIIIDKETEVPAGKTILITEAPFDAYCSLVKYFRPEERSDKMISTTSEVGSGSFIYPNVFIGNHVKIGLNCIIYPNVSILDHCEIGNNVIIQSGTVIGSNAFYYNGKKNRELWYVKMPDCGRVIIEDDVEIGANCTIDRGVSHDTVIGRGTKMDNMVHIGHDTIVGKNCLFAAQVAIAGAVKIENGVTLWGQVGVNKTLTIGENATVLGQSGVPSDIEGNKLYWGTPAVEAQSKRRELVWIKRIPELWEKLKGGN